MRRFFLALAATLCCLPALAADWSDYVNDRFGIAVAVPPGFVAGEPPANGDGLRFSTPTSSLSVFGSLLAEGGFEADVAQRKAWAGDDGWALTYEATTPGWAVWSGRKGSRILYARAIPICGGAAIGVFELDYSLADQQAFEPLITRLGRSLHDAGSGWQC